jgi:putative MATE family efflux protein
LGNATTAIRQDLTRGSIPRHVIRLAAPAVLSSLLHNLYSINDLVFAGWFVSKDAQSAVGASLFVTIMTFAFATMVSIGAMAIVSRKSGANAPEEEIAGDVRHGITFALLFGAVIGAIGFPLARPIMTLMAGGLEGVVEQGTIYLRGIFIGLPVIFLVPAIDSLYRARGTTAVPLLMEVFAVVANLVLNAVAVLVLDWGVAGIAVATVGSRLAAAAIGLVLISRGGLRLSIPLVSFLKPSRAVYARILRIGFPAGMRPFLFSLVFMVILGLVARYGDAPHTGLTVGVRIEGVCFLLMFGFGLAVGPMVGQNLGANLPERAARAAWIGALFAGIAGLVIGVVFLAIPRELMGLLTPYDDVKDYGAGYLRVVAVCQIFTALEVTLGQAFIGAGNTVPPLLITSVFNVLRIPGAWLFGIVLGGGPMAIWWVINVTAIGRGIGMLAWFKRGRWKSHALPEAGSGRGSTSAGSTTAPAD